MAAENRIEFVGYELSICQHLFQFGGGLLKCIIPILKSEGEMGSKIKSPRIAKKSIFRRLKTF